MNWLKSVKAQLALFITATVLLTGGILEGYHYAQSKRLLYQGTEQRGQLIADGIANNAYAGVANADQNLAKPLVDSALKDPNVLFVRLVTLATGVGGAHVPQTVAGGEQDAVRGDATRFDAMVQEAFARGDAKGDLRHDEGNVPFLAISSPVDSSAGGDAGDLGSLLGAKAEQKGFVLIGYSLAPVYRESRGFALGALLILFAVLIVGTVVSVGIAGNFTNPLSSIVDVSRRIAHGDLSHMLTARAAERQNEIGELMRSFNSMIVDLRRSRGEVEEYNRTLASKVDERTKQVEQAYADLKSREEAQKAYSEVLRTFNETADVNGVLREGLKGIVAFTQATIGAVYSWDDRDKKFHVSATQGLAKEDLPSFAIGEGFAGMAAQERKLRTMEKIDENVGWTVRTVAGDMKPKEILAVPVIYRDEVLGVIEIGTVAAQFDADRQRLLLDLVGQFAIALSNVIANERTRQLASSLQSKSRELEQQNRTLSEQSLALQRQQKDLDEKNRDLERASKLKSEFLANMSHELRTPMNSIIGYTDLVLNRAGEALDPRYRKNLDKVLANAQHLLSLINGILDLSKIEAGKMELFAEEFELQPLLESTAAMAEVLLKGKPVKLVQKIEPNLPRMKTDKTKLRQIVLNLLSNACKFTENGAVNLVAERVEGKRKGDPNQLLRITVQDSGIGMAEKDIPIIFEEFRQIDGSSTRKYGGTGLGLAIVKKMVGLMGGEITVTSQLGQGSTFYITLPLGEAAEAVAAAAAEATAGAKEKVLAEREKDRGILRAESEKVERTGKVAVPTTVSATDDDSSKKTVLVVDDEPDSVILVRENLAGQPYRVVSAFTADEGMRMAVKLKPFAILLDIMMPDKDGWDLIRELKDNPVTAEIPVVILSIVDNKPLGFSLGVTDYLLKPIDRDALVASLTRIAVRPVKDILVVDDDEGVREILDDMLKREGYRVTLAKNGVEAIEALKARLPDLMILDLMMPEMDGFQVVKSMRSDNKWKDIPVLICTAKELSQTERADLQRSVSRIVEKGSMQQDILLGELGTALRGIENQIASRGGGTGATPKAVAGRER